MPAGRPRCQAKLLAQELGEPTYVTGKPCRNGHESARRTSTGVCIECSRETARADYHKNKSVRRAVQAAYWSTEQGRAAKAQAKSKWRKRHRQTPEGLLTHRLRQRCVTAINKAKTTKTATFNQLLGCTYQALAAHIESRFQPGMSWENRDEWHIDHIKPCASFDLSCPDQQRACFHYTNLQPLWAQDNLRKGAAPPLHPHPSTTNL